MLQRILKTLMALALISLVVSPIIGTACFIMEDMERNYIGCVFVGFFVGIASIVVASIVQYILIGKLSPTYLFKKGL